MRKVNEQQTTFEQGGYDNSGLIVDGDANNPNAGSTVKSWAINDVIGAFAAILKGAGISSFNGQPETEDNSQIFAAIKHLIDSQKNIMDAKINALKEELETKYAALAGNNIFTGNNEFKASLSTEEAVNHNIMPNHNNIDLIDKGDLEAQNYADKNYVSGSISENNKNLVKIEQSTERRLRYYAIGTVLLVNCRYDNIYQTNATITVYFSGFEGDYYTKDSHEFSVIGGKFELYGTWRIRGYVSKSSYRSMLVQRVS